MNQRLSAVVIPMVPNEIDLCAASIRSWSRAEFRPTETTVPTCDLLVLSNVALAADSRRTLQEAYDSSHGARAAFRRLIFTSPQLRPEEDTYASDYIGEHQTTWRWDPGGYKAGPNSMFFFMMERCRGYSVVLQMENDVAVLRPEWLDEAKRVVSRWPHEFWVLGSAYQGELPLDDQFRHHINGNALYGTGAEGFQRFLKYEFRPYAERLIHHEDPRLAFDILFEVYLRDPAKWPIVQRLRHKFSYTPFIKNFAGSELLSSHPGLLDDLRSGLPETYLIHGRFGD